MSFGQSYDVELARGRMPMFPDMCIGCTVDAPRASYCVRSRGPSHHAYDVPACTKCSWLLSRTHVRRKLGYWGPTIAAVLAYGWFRLTHHPDANLWLWAAGGWLLLFVLYEVLRPEVLFLSLHEGTIVFEFRSRAYAHAFAAMNGATVE